MKLLNVWKTVLVTMVFPGLILNSCKTGIDEPDKVFPQNKMDSVSYIIGWDYGIGIREQEISPNAVMIYRGLVDALNEREGIFSDSVRQQLVNDFQKVIDKKEAERFRKMLQANKAEGKQFMEENRKKQGVFELPDGLQYKVLKIGSGDFPKPTDSVTIHYRAMYIDRTTFDMSYDKGPTGIRLNHMVKGLSEGIQLMRKGAIYEFYIPPGLAYGDKNYMDKIPGGSTVIYTVELIDIH